VPVSGHGFYPSDVARRLGLWTATEFAIFNVGIAATVVGLLLMSGDSVPGVVAFVITAASLATWITVAARMLQRARRERAETDQ